MWKKKGPHTKPDKLREASMADSANSEIESKDGLNIKKAFLTKSGLWQVVGS